MRIKDQIQMRREALGLSMKELADRVGVTEQAVRHWESGRSFPGKSKSRLVEEALTFNLDWAEGTPQVADGKTAAALVDQSDIELLMLIARLPLRAKNAVAEFARILDEARNNPPTPKAAPSPAPSPRRSRATATTSR